MIPGWAWIDVERGGPEREGALDRDVEPLVGQSLRVLAPHDEPIGCADRHHLDGRVVPGIHEVDGRHAVGPTPTNEIGHEQAFEDRRVGKECRSRWSPYH